MYKLNFTKEFNYTFSKIRDKKINTSQNTFKIRLTIKFSGLEKWLCRTMSDTFILFNFYDFLKFKNI